MRAEDQGHVAASLTLPPTSSSPPRPLWYTLCIPFKMTRQRFVSAMLMFVCRLSCYGNDVPVSGWTREARFVGFRYSIRLHEMFHDSALVAVKGRRRGRSASASAALINHPRLDAETADKLFCFGWVQKSDDFLVGEARCSKKRGGEMKAFLESLSPQCSLTFYEDTLLR